jgi:membrane protease YdiL (CAAX protease family)
VISALSDAGRTRTDLLLFFTGAFALSWLPWAAAFLAGGDLGQPLPYLLFVVGTFGPTAAAALLWLAGRRRPRGRNPFRTAHSWLLPALMFGAAPPVAAALVDGAVDLAAAGSRVATMGGPLLLIGFVLLAGPLAEEFGWRGYAQPRLRRTLAPVPTAVLLGFVWAAWHVPLFLISGTSQHAMGLVSWQAVLFFAAFLPLSYVIWAVSEWLHGGVAAAVAVHVAYNGAGGLFPASSIAAALVSTAVITAIAVVVHALVRRAPSAPTAVRPGSSTGSR